MNKIKNESNERRDNDDAISNHIKDEEKNRLLVDNQLNSRLDQTIKKNF